MLSKNKEYIVDIVDIGQGGVGIGKYDGFTVFVEGGLLNDKVKVKINKSKKNYAVGDIVEIIEKSPFRVDRLCSDSLKDCGGCQIQELDYKKQLEIKTNEVKQVISRIGKLENVTIYDTIGVLQKRVYRIARRLVVGIVALRVELDPLGEHAEHVFQVRQIFGDVAHHHGDDRKRRA